MNASLDIIGLPDPLAVQKWERDLLTDNKNHKNHFAETFTTYTVTQSKKRIKIRARLIYSGFEQFGIYILYILIPLIIYFIRVRGIIYVPIKLLLMILGFFISRKIIRWLFMTTILEVNKDHKTLRCPLDEFKVKISDIKDISVIEEVYLKNNKEFMKYKLNFVLPEGNKSSIFAFTSYDKTQKIIELLKNLK